MNHLIIREDDKLWVSLEKPEINKYITYYLYNGEYNIKLFNSIYDLNNFIADLRINRNIDINIFDNYCTFVNFNNLPKHKLILVLVGNKLYIDKRIKKCYSYIGL